MCPLVKFFQQIQSWLSARAFSFGDMYPIVEKGLSPCIRIYLGIQYASSRSVLLSVSSHLLSSSTFSMYPIVEKGLSPCIRIYLGIQYASSGSVLLSVSSHLLSSSTFSIKSLVLSSSGHSIRCAAVSRLPQFGHRLSGNASPEYISTMIEFHRNPTFA